VSKWECGENAPDLAVLLDLSKLLGVSCDALLGRSEEAQDTFAATVFCSDMNHFAERAARMSPRDVAMWANGIFHLVTEAVKRHDGVPIKYMGDGFLSFFSGPGHARRAVLAALDAKRLAANPDLVVALHSGDIYLGLIGHVEYARPDIIGNTVNTTFLALSWVAQHLRGGIGMTETVVAQAEGACTLGPPRWARLERLKARVKIYAPA
jgi:class 3 adenylate cyclase